MRCLLLWALSWHCCYGRPERPFDETLRTRGFVDLSLLLSVQIYILMVHGVHSLCIDGRLLQFQRYVFFGFVVFLVKSMPRTLRISKTAVRTKTLPTVNIWLRWTCFLNYWCIHFVSYRCRCEGRLRGCWRTIISDRWAWFDRVDRLSSVAWCHLSLFSIGDFCIWMQVHFVSGWNSWIFGIRIIHSSDLHQFESMAQDIGTEAARRFDSTSFPKRSQQGKLETWWPWLHKRNLFVWQGSFMARFMCTPGNDGTSKGEAYCF